MLPQPEDGSKAAPEFFGKKGTFLFWFDGGGGPKVQRLGKAPAAARLCSAQRCRSVLWPDGGTPITRTQEALRCTQPWS